MRTILVTGAAGFIGSNLCEKLVKNAQVIAVDNLVTGSLENLKILGREPNFKFIKTDILKPLKISRKIDQIYNLACPASPLDFLKYSLEIMEVCSAGVRNMLDLAKKHQAVFLQASTSEVYGDPKVHPQKEDYWGWVNPIGARSCYDEGKRFAEALVKNYQKKFGLKAKIVRIFNTYGPRMRSNDGRVIPNFISQALSGKDLTVYGEGFQTRSFCFVDDMVDGLLKMMKSDEDGPINLGSPEEIKIEDLAKMIIDLTGSSSKIVYRRLPSDDPQKRKPDISLAKKTLDWSPKVNLKSGLKRTIEYFRKTQ